MRLFSHRQLVLLTFVGIVALGLFLAQPATASTQALPPAQPTPFLTPTPGPDGKIIYIVQPGDTLFRIAAIADMTVEELAALNGMQVNDLLPIGTTLFLGTGGPVEPTLAAGFEPTPTLTPPSPTPEFGMGEICVLLFLDENGNARLEEGEEPLPEGQVSVADVSGALAGEYTTNSDPEGYCFVDLEMGDYNVSAAVPPDYNPTTVMNLPVRLEPGDIKYVQFGAQPSSAFMEGTTGGGGDRSTLLGLLGVFLLLAGGGLGYLASRYGRRTSSSLR
jgi:LysM repeat protein